MKVNFDYIDKYPPYVFNWTGSNRYSLMKEYVRSGGDMDQTVFRIAVELVIASEREQRLVDLFAVPGSRRTGRVKEHQVSGETEDMSRWTSWASPVFALPCNNSKATYLVQIPFDCRLLDVDLIGQRLIVLNVAWPLVLSCDNSELYSTAH
jgi:hypothetical protein